jgi:ABC-type multidrug transport system ATPase subunit
LPVVPVLLEARGLTVRRGRRTVLAGVGFEVGAGRAIRVSGANGSGKTSLLRVLAGLAVPRAGTVLRHGVCAFVPERVRLAPALRCGEWLRAMRGLRGLATTDWTRAVSASGLDPAVLGRPAATLSRGMLQRVALLEAVQSGCPLLLLDEPFSGLDDDGRAWLAAELAERLDGGAAVVLTDHSGSAAERLAPHEVLRLRHGTCVLLDGPAPPAAASARRTAALMLRASHPDGRRLQRAVAEDAVDAVLRALLDDGWHIEEVRR